MMSAEIHQEHKHRTPVPTTDDDKAAANSKGRGGGRVAEEFDDFGLPIRPPSRRRPGPTEDDSDTDTDTFHDAEDAGTTEVKSGSPEQQIIHDGEKRRPGNDTALPELKTSTNSIPGVHETTEKGPDSPQGSAAVPKTLPDMIPDASVPLHPADNTQAETVTEAPKDIPLESLDHPPANPTSSSIKQADKRHAVPTVSEWSHQRLVPQEQKDEESDDEVDWQAMPALGEFDVYDDEGHLVAKGNKEIDENAYAGVGGAGKGYTRVQLDEDVQSITSMDDHTNYLFKENQGATLDDDDDDGGQRDASSQLKATKDLLTEGQRIAYVGVTRLTIYNMVKELHDIDKTKGTKKELIVAFESMEKWGQQMMVRLYSHMEIDPAEQIMIEQLAEHGVQPLDLVPPLMQTSKVKNPLADTKSPKSADGVANGHKSGESSSQASTQPSPVLAQDSENNEELPQAQLSEDMLRTEKIDIDLRWTVLCDLFLVLISNGVYDSRSRQLLEKVASAMDISWVQICRFEKRVMDALEMQEEGVRENWNEDEHLENRRKLGLKRKYMVMGLATVGGGLVIGLSAGLLAPVIGAGLAAGFTTIGVTGTAGFLGGVGGAALITSAATAAGGTIAVRASNRRTGHVKTFEYRPLHNNKRLNLILTVSGWMNGKVDDVRLPYSTVDPIMGDIYSLLWEPEMLQSMGDTINILATEALTQTVQQVLGSTILITLMASIQLPVVLTKLSYLIDNPWTVSLDRANSAGLILADSLIDRHLGQRPITLLGFSLGSRLIFSCLKELANRGAYGLIQNVYLFGSPIVAKRDEYLRARSVVSGRFVNGYASNDWILGYLFRATSGGIMRVAGLSPVEGVPGLENLDVTGMVNGHMAYRAAMPKLLREVGWEVESDEFTEIEDPDPENHAQRQRELIKDIDDARKKAEEKPEKRRFGLFKRGKLAQKKGWETYDASKQAHARSRSEGSLNEPNVLFDIEAIRRELESEMIEVRELDSTLPPMQISIPPNGEKKTTPLVLPPNLHPDEISAMKLPPRPDEIDDHFYLPGSNGVHKLRTPRKSPEMEYEFEAPRELKSTLPPLTLTPSSPSGPPFQNFALRPDLKSHSSTPSHAPPTWNSRSASPNKVATPLEDIPLEHNAWADDESFDRGRGIHMTFE